MKSYPWGQGLGMIGDVGIIRKERRHDIVSNWKPAALLASNWPTLAWIRVASSSPGCLGTRLRLKVTFGDECDVLSTWINMPKLWIRDIMVPLYIAQVSVGGWIYRWKHIHKYLLQYSGNSQATKKSFCCNLLKWGNPIQGTLFGTGVTGAVRTHTKLHNASSHLC